MRALHALVLLALALPAAHAACPPAGQTQASLQALKASGFEVADAGERLRLAQGLVACLADPDPALRDGIAYEALAHWMRAKRFDADPLRRLRGQLMALLDADDPQGFGRPFAALVLSEVARTDRIDPWMSPAERVAMVDAAARYVEGVRDYRGFDAKEGWRHGVAHGADWLMQLALDPALERAQLERILEAVATQAVPASGHAYVFGEPGRLARPVLFVAARGALPAGHWQAWLDAVVQRAGPPAYTDPAWLARRHDLVAFLQALYVATDRSDVPAVRALKAPVASALAKLG